MEGRICAFQALHEHHPGRRLSVDFSIRLLNGDAARLFPLYAMALGLASLRFNAFFLVFPLLTKSNAGRIVPNCLSIALGLPLVEPLVFQLSSLQGTSGWVIVAIAFKEMFFGLLLGAACSVPFWAVQMAGELIDNLRGITTDSNTEPIGRGQGSTLNIFFGFFALCLFMSMQGLELLVGTVYSSFATWPILTPFARLPSGDVTSLLGKLLEQIMLYAMVVAGPLVVLFMACAFAGMLLAKSAQQIVTEQTVSLLKNTLFVLLSSTYVIYMSRFFLEQALVIPAVVKNALSGIAQ
jgi:type III secretion protein T